jgi:hypothetical protein
MSRRHLTVAFLLRGKDLAQDQQGLSHVTLPDPVSDELALQR